jgi:eukaryotic-like serine/threonine-protein kinase
MSATDILHDWNTLQGTTLDGGYELKDIVAAERDRAVLRVRVLGDYSLKASAAFYALDPATAEEEVSLWQSVRAFEKRGNVSVPLGAGKLRMNGSQLAYLVFQNPDETLQDVLRSRALQPEEAVDLVRSVARGLSELHANGYVHGCLAPEEVLAVGDNIEVSTRWIRRVNAEPAFESESPAYLAPESEKHNVTIAADIWCLGATVFEALTQKKYEAGLLEEAAALKHPFGTLLAGCLEPNPEKRVKLPEFEAILRSKAPFAKPKPATVPPVETGKAPAAPPVNGAASAPVAAVNEPPAQAPIEQPAAGPTERVTAIGAAAEKPISVKFPNEPVVRPVTARSEPRRERSEEPAGLSRRKGWIYAIGAFLLIFLSLWLLRWRAHPATPTAQNQAVPAAAKQPGSAWPTQTLTPDAKAPARNAPVAATPARRAPATVERSTASASAGQPRTIWRVVLYTYRKEQDAKNKAQDIATRQPDLQTEVFAPSEAAGPYLVVAGGKMNREDAARLRSKAIHEGMPRDSYIQNYSK